MANLQSNKPCHLSSSHMSPDAFLLSGGDRIEVERLCPFTVHFLCCIDMAFYLYTLLGLVFSSGLGSWHGFLDESCAYYLSYVICVRRDRANRFAQMYVLMCILMWGCTGLDQSCLWIPLKPRRLS